MGCDDTTEPPADSSTPSDVSTDTAVDASPDAAPDATVDAAADVTPADVTADTTPADVTADATPADVTADAAPADVTADATPADVTADAAPADVTPADAGTETVFEAALSGAQEVPAVSTTATGTATVTLNAARTVISYVVRHTIPTATAGHIHIGAPGINGGVAVAFASVGAEITGMATVTPAQVASLESGEMYVNLHTTANPGGELRGQVLRRGEELFVAPLTGVQEVPRVTTTATGTASVIFNPATATFHYRVVTTLTPSAAHIHRAMAGVAGPVAYPLAPLGAAIDNFQAVTPADVDAIRSGLFYVNLHTTANPGGELRGQLLTPGTQLFVANLTGAQENPPVTTTSTGSGMVLLNYARDTVRVVLTSTATATAAHLHRGAGGANGPVAVALTTLGSDFVGNAAVTPADAALIESGGFYANVHTTANPGGEVRGQVLRPGEVLYTAALSGANEVPAVTTAAAGSAALVLNAAGTTVSYTGVLNGLTPTAAHIHEAAVGATGPVAFPLVFTPTSLGGTITVTPGYVSLANAGGYYVNVHTAANPGGELRGQITRR
jgi:hypothetical protein